MRSNTLDVARRAYLGLVRGVVNFVADNPLMQTIDARLLHNELLTGIERFQHYGFTAVPQPPDANGKAAEAVVGFIHGNRSHPVMISVDDRRYRPKNYKPGESAHYDDQGQYSKIARASHDRVAKQHTFTAAGTTAPGGTTPPDTTFELNEQLKGLAARVAQAEHNLHGLFDVTSQFRSIVQQTIPAVSAVAGILNQDPSGLMPMANAIIGKEQAYLQQQVTQALQKFLSPNLAGLTSLLSGNLESSIGSLQTQIAGLVAANPVVGTVDGLTAQIAALASSGAPATTVTQVTATLQAQIAALTAANPVVGTVAGLRTTLQGMLTTAGEALNFLVPQQRLVQGLSRSLNLQHS